MAEQLASTQRMAEDLVQAQRVALKSQEAILRNGEELKFTLHDSTQGDCISNSILGVCSPAIFFLPF